MRRLRLGRHDHKPRNTWSPRNWKSWERRSPRAWRAGGPGPADTLPLDFWPPELGENQLVCLKLPAVCGRGYQKPHQGHSMFCVSKIQPLTVPSARPVFPHHDGMSSQQ